MVQPRYVSWSWYLGWAVAAMCILAAVVGGAFVLWGLLWDGTSSTVIPQGWHVATQPPGDFYGGFAISPDIPGLIMDCPNGTYGSGNSNHRIKLYRSDNYGATWEPLTPPFDVSSGCELSAPEGGHGTFFLMGWDSTNNQPLAAVSHDDGSTWNVLQSANVPDSATLDDAVYRGGVLYSSVRYGIPYQSAQPTAFTESRDDGQTWTPIETPEPGITTAPVALAPDASSLTGWYRLTIPVIDADAQNLSVPLLLQHSNDNGRTWQIVSTVGQSGKQLGGPHSIATSASHPERICVATAATGGPVVAQGVTQHAALAAALGSHSEVNTHTAPNTAEYVDGLYASDDGGHTWTGGILPVGTRWSGTVSRVAMGADGTCYATNSVLSLPTFATDRQLNTVWTLAPDTSVPTTLAQFTGSNVDTSTLQDAAGKTPARMLLTITTHAANPNPVCAVFRCDHPTFMSPTRLVWKDVP